MAAMTAATGQLTVAAVIVAAGDGVRLGAGRPKAFCVVAGATLLEHAVSRLRVHSRIAEFVIVVPPDWLNRARSLVASEVGVVGGGTTRQQSVAAGLRALSSNPQLVLVHDVARAFVPSVVVERVLAALDDGADAAIPVIPVIDTLTSVSATGEVLGTVDRKPLRAVQTPQGFRFAQLIAAHAAASDLEHTDDASMVERQGGQVVAVEGSELAFKITRPLDLQLAEIVAS